MIGAIWDSVTNRLLNLSKENQRLQNQQQELLNTNPSAPNISTHLLEENNKTGKEHKNESSNLYPHNQLTEISNITQPFPF